jgi:hypothetical protein
MALRRACSGEITAKAEPAGRLRTEGRAEKTGQSNRGRTDFVRVLTTQMYKRLEDAVAARRINAEPDL